jgi:hypothetical protein
VFRSAGAPKLAIAQHEQRVLGEYAWRLDTQLTLGSDSDGLRERRSRQHDPRA